MYSECELTVTRQRSILMHVRNIHWFVLSAIPNTFTEAGSEGSDKRLQNAG